MKNTRIPTVPYVITVSVVIIGGAVWKPNALNKSLKYHSIAFIVISLQNLTDHHDEGELTMYLDQCHVEFAN